uniref:Uncharacterized protein n=1 Tax=Chromera velia CCMP2878 TaxID=1169474 RepID=A0A0G4F7H0_9ALVE|mmetsp:Transcript_34763/g.68627  ORF Transcript_34763/g.68627 Transcript_34763/m.68627 type:complete len:196 (+) Transcript_34763:198-785(+)|eukprot:Cvel_15523.t1-p1 / transcript=Cvel_15523.t1 / gene=Cvel_15523 / organism=Chromera_velia_CCMP2878 / gene_product=hypothetical protein / transcript_product=hypothetical protein / location=Cvel_scaffold1153:9536-13920(-) / protein_length=195 / sequence_SO=supercontig / SO=protein_coding / is_pseudo=false
MRSLSLSVLFLFLVAPVVRAAKWENVLGQPLGVCDRSKAHDPNPNFAATGYERNNQCTSNAPDAGSHYVCVDLPAGQQDSEKDPAWSNFWTETGQASDKADAQQSFPKPGPWCICMWAFADMLSQHPNFKSLLDCPAVNKWVVERYDSNNSRECKALVAVCDQCGVGGSSVPEALSSKCKEAKSKCGGSFLSSFS